MKEFLSIITGLILSFLVIWCAYKFSRVFAARITGRAGMRKYMAEIDKLVIGAEEYISIVKTGSKYYMIGVTKQNINLISEIDEEDLIEIESKRSDTESFTGTSEFFKAFKEKIKNLPHS